MLKFGAGKEEAWGRHTGLISMLMSIPKVLEKGTFPKVFYEIKMTSQMLVVRTNTCLKEKRKEKKKLIIATINYSSIPFAGIIKFTDAKTFF